MPVQEEANGRQEEVRARRTATQGGEPPRDPSREPTPPKGATKHGLLQTLGPGLITGASDDDPSGIATYSQVGAQFGFGMLWTMLFSYPLMAAIQEISGQIGRVTGRGIAGNLRKHYSPFWLYSLVLLVFCANVINLGADVNAMGAAMRLVVGGPTLLWAVLFAALALGLEVFVAYEKYTAYLKWMCMVLFAYVATVFVVHVPWGQASRRRSAVTRSEQPTLPYIWRTREVSIGPESRQPRRSPDDQALRPE